MDIALAEIIATVTIVTIVGILLVSIPITRRLGRALEAWIRFQTEGAPDRSALGQMSEQLQAIQRHMEALDDRMQLVAERQDFTESLIESSRAERSGLPPGG